MPPPKLPAGSSCNSLPGFFLEYAHLARATPLWSLLLASGVLLAMGEWLFGVPQVGQVTEAVYFEILIFAVLVVGLVVASIFAPAIGRLVGRVTPRWMMTPVGLAGSPFLFIGGASLYMTGRLSSLGAGNTFLHLLLAAILLLACALGIIGNPPADSVDASSP